MQQQMSTSDIPRSIGRVLDLLEIVVAGPKCSLTDAASTAQLTPTTALRYLRALEARGYLQRDEAARYSAGPTVRQLAALVHEGGPLDRLIAAAQPCLESLADECGESCYLAVGDGRRATYVAAAESSRALRHVGWVGQTVPLEGTAVGAALAEPGVPHVRSGSVEPDITAISYGIGLGVPVPVALSVVGPAHRLDLPAQQAAGAALAVAAGDLARKLDLARTDPEEAAS